MKRKYRKLFSLLLAAVMLLNMGVGSVFAEEMSTDTHEHNEACGYAEGGSCDLNPALIADTYQVKVIVKQGDTNMTYTISNPTPAAGELITVTVETTRSGYGTAGIDFYDNKTWNVITIPGHEIKRSYDNPNQFTFTMPSQDVNLRLRADKKHDVQTDPYWQPAEVGVATPASLDGSIPAVSYIEKGKKMAEMFLAFTFPDSLTPDGFLTKFEGGADYGTIDCSGEYLTYTPNAAAAGKTVKFYVKAYIGGGVSSAGRTFTAVVGSVPNPALSQDASLKTLSYSVDGDNAVPISLQNETYEYDVTLPYGMPEKKEIVLSGESSHASATIIGKSGCTTSCIKQETSLTVQAEDPSATQTYTVNFMVQAPDTEPYVLINDVNYTNNERVTLEAGQEHTLKTSLGSGASSAGSCSYQSSNFDKVSVSGAHMGFYPSIYTSHRFTPPVACDETITIKFYKEATTDHRGLSPIQTITLHISTTNISVKINGGEEIYGTNLQDAVEVQSEISPEKITSLEITSGNLDYNTDMNYLLGEVKTKLTNLTSLVVSNAVTDNFPYGNFGLFQYWTSLKEATIGFKSLDDYLFMGCTSLESAIFPRATAIVSDAFEDCNRLKTLGLPATPPKVTGNLSGIPKNVILVPVAEDGMPLSGTDLANARSAYQNANDGDTTDDVWYGLDLAFEYNVTLPKGLGYTVKGGTDPVQYGEDYTFTFTLADGYGKTDAFSVKINGSTVALKEDGSYTIQKVTENQNITVEGVADTTAPTGEIIIGENKWTSFLNTITFGLSFKETQTVNLTATDAGSGVDKIYYHLSETALAEDEVKGLPSSFWKEEKNKDVSPNWKGIVYAKLTDKVGNTSYISSDGLVFDATAPAITGATDGETYCISRELKIADDYLETVKVDGSNVTLTDGKVTVIGKPTAQTITVTDKAGNTASITITVNAAHTPNNDDEDCTTIITCSVCNYEITAAKEHVLSDWQTDEANHWKKCTNEGCTHTEQTTVHNFGDWIIDTEASETEKGSKHRDCEACGYTEAVERPVLPHTHKRAEEWSSDASNHWHKCTANDGERLDMATHTPGDAATIEQSQVCTVCDYVMAEKLPSKNAIVNDSTDITVEYEDGSAFDSTVILSVTSKPQSEMDKFKDRIDKAVPGLVLGGLYDIKLLKDGVAIEPDGEIKVTIPLTEKLKSMTDLKVVYIDHNGKVTIIPSVVKDDKIIFVTDHFSYFGVIGKVKATGPGDKNGGGDMNGGGNNNSNNGNASSPQTGDSSPVVLFVLMILASGTALIILVQKRRMFKHTG